jgi:hypothetical protein
MMGSLKVERELKPAMTADGDEDERATVPPTALLRRRRITVSTPSCIVL